MTQVQPTGVDSGLCMVILILGFVTEQLRLAVTNHTAGS